jgi:hypothetical protein
MNNNDRQRTDVLDDDGAPHAAERRRPPSASPIGDGKAKSPERRSTPDASGNIPVRTQAQTA